MKGLSLRGLPGLKSQSRPLLLAFLSLGLHGLFLSIPLSAQLAEQGLQVGAVGKVSSLDFATSQFPIGSFASDSGAFITESSTSSNKAALKPTVMMVEPARSRVRPAMAEAISSQTTTSQPTSKILRAKPIRPSTIIVRPQRVVRQQTVVIRTVTQPPVFISVDRSPASHTDPTSLASDRNFGSDLGLELASKPESSPRKAGVANAANADSGNILSLVADQTPSELFKGYFWPNLQGKGYDVSAAPIGEYAGGPVYQVKRGALLGYLNLVPTGDGKGTLVVMWRRSPLTGKGVPTGVRLKKPEQKEAGAAPIAPGDSKSEAGAN